MCISDPPAIRAGSCSPGGRCQSLRRQKMAKVLVLYYSSYGHLEIMAGAVADGARSVAGTEVTIKRVPELVPDEVAKKSGFKPDQKAPIAKPEELPDYDAHILGIPTRYGNMEAQMRHILDTQRALCVYRYKKGQDG